MRLDSPLLTAALAALEREADANPDAARLLEIIEDLTPFCRHWSMLDALAHFDCENGVKARPALMSVLLKELSAAFPVPLSLLH